MKLKINNENKKIINIKICLCLSIYDAFIAKPQQLFQLNSTWIYFGFCART